MGKLNLSKIIKKKSWSYDEYYIGDKDENNSRNGEGENHWTGAKSIEWYKGQFLNDTIHGKGEYKWTHYQETRNPCTYEGHFYANKMHGYGTISYSNSKVFEGLLYNNFRWGPGIETFACLAANVGLWYGNHLIRLAWAPDSMEIVPNLTNTPTGMAMVESHRITLTAVTHAVCEVNSAFELLKQCAANPQTACDRWRSVYPTKCTDIESALCYKKMFELTYCKGTSKTLHVNNKKKGTQNDTAQEESEKNDVYYAWNNSPLIVSMMIHSFKHEDQRPTTRLKLASMLGGPRPKFKSAAKHELDCRSLLMASYLGHAISAMHLISERLVHPDVADSSGNTALMYAVCGDNVEVIRFLVEAGASINNYNDSCCTPLAIALIRFVAKSFEVPMANINQLVTPPAKHEKVGAQQEKSIIEWNISHYMTPLPRSNYKAGSVMSRLGSTRKLKSIQSMKQSSSLKSKSAIPARVTNEHNSDEDFCEIDKRTYKTLCHEYLINVTDSYGPPTGKSIQSIFFCNDILNDIIMFEDLNEKPLDNKSLKRAASKLGKDTTSKMSSQVFWLSRDKDLDSDDSNEKLKLDQVSSMKLTIIELLEHGAKPGAVRCPLPALVLAIAADSADLVRVLIQYGANPNETYEEMLNYTAVELTVSRPLTLVNLNVLIALLEGGGRADLTLHHEAQDPDGGTPTLGPTLLHAVLAKLAESETEKDVQSQMLGLLLNYGSDATSQFKGRSAIDLAMTRQMHLFPIFIKSSKVDLNSIINDSHHTVLAKMFNFKFFQNMDRSDNIAILTNLLLFGADPLVPCQNEEKIYDNLFMYANEQLCEMEDFSKKSGCSVKPDAKLTKTKSITTAKTIGDSDDYKQSLELVAQCSRLIHIRWLQAALLKELVQIVHKYKHRSWHLIILEHKQETQVTSWLTTQRCLEIWDILRTTKNSIYKDKRVLKLLLCIVYYYNCRHKLSKKLTAQEKDMVEADVNNLLTEYTTAYSVSDIVPWNRHYVKPELESRKNKFQICFECSMRLPEVRIQCHICQMVSFCSKACLKVNIERTNCHPCSSSLKEEHYYCDEEAVSI